MMNEVKRKADRLARLQNRNKKNGDEQVEDYKSKLIKKYNSLKETDPRRVRIDQVKDAIKLETNENLYFVASVLAVTTKKGMAELVQRNEFYRQYQQLPVNSMARQQVNAIMRKCTVHGECDLGIKELDEIQQIFDANIPTHTSSTLKVMLATKMTDKQQAIEERKKADAILENYIAEMKLLREQGQEENIANQLQQLQPETRERVRSALAAIAPITPPAEIKQENNDPLIALQKILGDEAPTPGEVESLRNVDREKIWDCIRKGMTSGNAEGYAEKMFQHNIYQTLWGDKPVSRDFMVNNRFSSDVFYQAMISDLHAMKAQFADKSLKPTMRPK